MSQESSNRRRRDGRYPPPSQPRLEPVTATQAKAYDSRPHESLEEVRARVIAEQAVRQLAPDIAASRRAAPGAAVSGFSALSALVGPNLAARVPGTLTAEGKKPTHTAAGTAVDLALNVPILRGPRAAVRGVKALASGASAAEAARTARASLKEAGPISRAVGKFRADRAGSRSVTLGEHVQQFPQSPSWITAKGQRLLDRASERLAGTATSLRESDSAVARGVGKALTPASARARVPKQAGKFVRQEGRRRQATRAVELRAIRDVGSSRIPLVRNSGEQAAHFWYAQLPAAYRNPEGLKLVRGKLAEELDGYTSGRVSEEIAQRLGELEAAQREASAAGDTAKLYEAMDEAGKLKGVLADIPERVKSLGENVSKLDRIISKPVPVNQDALDALGVLARDREAILERAGKLGSERAAERAGLVSRWLGLEPSGEEIYMGHRIGDVRGARPSGLPGGVGTGRTQLPQGVATTNRLQLAKTGRLRQSLEPAIEDWQAAQAYEFHNIAKDELAKMGEPVIGRPKPGYVVINPKGHTLPRHWQVDAEARALEEGFDPESVLVHDLEEYVRNYVAEGADAQRLIEEAAKAGHLHELRQVPRDVYTRYVQQFLPPKLLAATPGLKEGTSLGGKVANVVNDAIYASLIYSNPGYVPANAAANLLMAGAHQGALLPLNLIRAGQVLTRGPKRLRDLLKVEIGAGATVAASSGPLEGVARVVGGLPDNWPRVSAFIHEAARVGVIPKTRVKLTREDYRRLEEFLTNPASRPLLNDVRDRAVQAMVDFERLGPWEKVLAKRLLFVWSWIRGATRYPFRFALDHPIRSALLGYAAAGAPGAPDALQERLDAVTPTAAHGMPPWLEGALNAGETTIDGKTYPRVLPTRAISPVSTPWELASTAVNRPGAQTIGDMLNPGLQAALNVAYQRSPYGRDVGSYGEAAKQAAERLVPDAGLVRDLVHPDGSGLYPGDATRLGRLERASRVFPIAVDPEEAYKARVREGMVSREDQAAHKLEAQLAKLDRLPVDDESRAALTQALRLHSRLDLAYSDVERKTDPGRDREAQKMRATISVLAQSGALSQEDVRVMERDYSDPTLTAKELQHDRHAIVAGAIGEDVKAYNAMATELPKAPDGEHPTGNATPSLSVGGSRSLQSVGGRDGGGLPLEGLRNLAQGTYDPSQMIAQLLAEAPSQDTLGETSLAPLAPEQVSIEGKSTARARSALQLVRQYLGTPYVWGGESPGGFDCSGLLQYVWSKVGVSIPRTTYDQFQAGKAVAKSNLRPGDAVFFTGSDAMAGLPGHVGMYIGGGQFIEAPHTGAVVRVARLAGRTDYAGARRFA